MLASLNSFLPSVLQSSHEPTGRYLRGETTKSDDEHTVADDNDTTVSDPDVTMTEAGAKKKEKRDKNPSEVGHLWLSLDLLM